MGRGSIDGGVDRDGVDAELLGGSDNSSCNFASIGDEEGLELLHGEYVV